MSLPVFATAVFVSSPDHNPVKLGLLSTERQKKVELYPSTFKAEYGQQTNVRADYQATDFKYTNAIDINLSRRYDFGGYFFRFPNPVHDVLGFVDYSTTPEKGRQVLAEQGYGPGKMRGQFINQSLDYPLNDRILLVGDAGGFAHRITYEGIYSAFVTGRNAAQAIATGKPFRQVNAAMWRRTRRDLWAARMFYSHAFFHLLRFMSHCPRLMKACFDKEIRHRL